MSGNSKRTRARFMELSIEALRESLSSSNVEIRLMSCRRLSWIAYEIGEDRTLQELLPLLTREILDDDEDEVLITVAEELGAFIPYVGGMEHANILLLFLERLCTADKSSVRNKVVESLCKIGSQMRETDFIESFIPLLKRLAADSHSWAAARASSCGLFQIAYPIASEPLRSELRTLYCQLCQDAFLIVRRAAATNIGKFAATIEQRYLKNEVCEADGPDAIRTDLVNAYMLLLYDDVVEIRTAAAGQLTKFFQIVSPELLVQHIAPCIKELFSDAPQHVRSAALSIVVAMNPILGKPMPQEFIEAVTDGLKSTDVLVKWICCQRLSIVAGLLGEKRTREELLLLLIHEILDDDEEEVLLTVAEQLGGFIPYVGGIEHASVLIPFLESLCIADKSSVRNKVVESLCNIGSQMRETDFINSFIPLLKRLATASNLGHVARASSIGLFQIAYQNAPEHLRNELIIMYSQLCQDDMPMVRRAAATNLGKFAATIEQPYLTNEPCEAVGPDATRTDLVNAYVWLLCDVEAEVRTVAAGQFTKFCQIVSPELLVQHILPRVKVLLSSDSLQHVCSAVAFVSMIMAPFLAKADDSLIQLYHKFITDFEIKINFLKLAHFAVNVSQQYSEKEAAIGYLEGVVEILLNAKDIHIEEPILYIKLQIALFKLGKGDQKDCKKLLEQGKTTLDSMTDIDPSVYASYYWVSSQYHKARQEFAEFYISALRSLAYTSVGCLSEPFKLDLAFDLFLSALLGDNVYNFSELLAHPIIKSLIGSKGEWLYYILEALTTGDLVRYQELSGIHQTALSAQPALVQNEKKLLEKINILCLMEIIVSRSAEDRTIPLSAIAEHTKLNVEDIEYLLMKSLSVHLIEGTIDQVEGTVLVSWVQPRFLDIPQVQSLRDRLDHLGDKVHTTSLFMEAETRDFS